jgi:hypothetical protein
MLQPDLEKPVFPSLKAHGKPQAHRRAERTGENGSNLEERDSSVQKALIRAALSPAR